MARRGRHWSVPCPIFRAPISEPEFGYTVGEHPARIALARQMRRPIHDEVWARLAAEGYLDDWETVGNTANEPTLLKEMAAKTRRLEDGGAPKPKKPSRLADDEQDRRLLIISTICAHDARKREDVQQFRAEVLGDVVPVDEVPAWITARAEPRVVPRESITIEIPPGHRLARQESGDGLTWRVDPPLLLDEVVAAERCGRDLVRRAGPAVKVGSSVPVLQWSDPSQDWVSSTPVTKGSDLDQLRLLSTRLSADYGWGNDTAVAFVLADAVPLVKDVSVQARVEGFGAQGGGRPRRRVVVEADATTSPTRVAAAYSAARRELGVKGTWPLRGKTARLLEFAIGLADALPWHEKMRRWNEDGARGGTERYSEARQFGRDVNRAFERLGAVLQIGSRNADTDDERHSI